MNDLEMAAKFREAASVLQRQGWMQGDYERGGRHCAIGALGHACGFPVADETFYAATDQFWPLVTVAAEHVFGREVGGINLGIWNDRPERTADEVVALFETVAHDLELRHQIAATSPLPAASRHDAIIPSLEAVPV